MSVLVLGRIKTLIDRLTSTRAANLDKLDANITTRAAASTALSNVTWTGTKAGYLDASISSRAPSSTALSSAVWTNTKAGYLDAPISGISGSPGLFDFTPQSDRRVATGGHSTLYGQRMQFTDWFSQTTTSTSQQTCFEVTSACVIEFLAVSAETTSQGLHYYLYAPYTTAIWSEASLLTASGDGCVIFGSNYTLSYTHVYCPGGFKLAKGQSTVQSTTSHAYVSYYIVS